jgi:ribosome-binding protein aMBF1 (putative translation factor)
MDAVIMKEQNVVASMILTEKRAKVADIVLAAREKKGWSQTELADRVGYSRSTIQRIESRVFSPNADQLYMILECLGVTLKLNNEKI